MATAYYEKEYIKNKKKADDFFKTIKEASDKKKLQDAEDAKHQFILSECCNSKLYLETYNGMLFLVCEKCKKDSGRIL
jgi:hypothetical protein